jgi:hypothetical protein
MLRLKPLRQEQWDFSLMSVSALSDALDATYRYRPHLSSGQIGAIIVEKSRAGKKQVILWKDHTIDCLGPGMLLHPSLANVYGTMNRRSG